MRNLPYRQLACLPTALEEAPRLGELLNISLYIKRDDNTGLAVGGNKARKLEYLVGDALAKGTNVLITTGGPQSNHCRMTAAAAAKSGLECHLVFNSDEISARQANMLLDELLGAVLHFTGSSDGARSVVYMEELRRQLIAQGKKPYVIPLGGSNCVGAVGYLEAVKEVGEQSQKCGINFDVYVHASGSAGTQAGILAGVKECDLNVPVYGISVSRSKQALADMVLALANETLHRIGSSKSVMPEDVVVFDEYVGKGYGVPTAQSKEALSLFAKLEGLILDPVYTAKSAAGLIDLVKRGVIAPKSTVLYWHTGGSPALFADEKIHWEGNK